MDTSDHGEAAKAGNRCRGKGIVVSIMDNRFGTTQRRTAYHHPEGNSYIERFHRSLKEEEVWPAEHRSVQEARESIGRWTQEYKRDRPHHGVQNRTLHESFLAFACVLKNELLTA